MLDIAGCWNSMIKTICEYLIFERNAITCIDSLVSEFTATLRVIGLIQSSNIRPMSTSSTVSILLSYSLSYEWNRNARLMSERNTPVLYTRLKRYWRCHSLSCLPSSP